jgi:hypothetical protein
MRFPDQRAGVFIHVRIAWTSNTGRKRGVQLTQRFPHGLVKRSMIISLAIICITPLWGQMKLQQELVRQQEQGELKLSSFGHGSIYSADFTRRNEWIEEKKLLPPADRIQDGLLSPDGKLVALTPTARVVVVFFSAHHRGYYSELEDAIGRMSEEVWAYFNYRSKK